MMGPLRQQSRLRASRARSRNGHLSAAGEAQAYALGDLTPAALEGWHELAQGAVEPNPFFEPEFVLPAVKGLGTRGVELLVVREGSDWIGAMPVRRVGSWRRIPLSGAVAWKSSYTYLGSPLLRRDSADAAARALLESAVRGRRYLGLELLQGGGPAAAAIERAAEELGLATTVLRSYERASLNRRDDPTGYVALKPKHRRELRRLRDRLGEEVGAEVEVCDDSGSAAAIEEFLGLEASGWKRQSRTALATRGHGEMFTRICQNFATEGRLQLLTMRAAQHRIAAKCNLIAGEGVFCFKIGFDENWARFSPGRQLEAANIDIFHANPQLAWMDSCAEPTNQMINRLWPDRRTIEVKAVTGGGTGRAAERVFRAAVQTRDLIKKGSQ